MTTRTGVEGLLGGAPTRSTTQRCDAEALLAVQLRITRQLLDAHTRLIEQAVARGAMTLPELLEHEDLLAKVRGVVDAQTFWLDAQDAS